MENVQGVKNVWCNCFVNWIIYIDINTFIQLEEENNLHLLILNYAILSGYRAIYVRLFN